MTIRTDLTKTVEIFDPIDPEIRQVGDELIYRCINCEEKIGKSDKIGKLYYNPVKQVGYCFRCHTVFYPEDEETDETKQEFKITATIALKKYATFIPEPLQPIQFLFEPLNKKMIQYLKLRNPLLPGLTRKLGFQAWYGSNSGIVTPFFYKNQIVKFQTRFTDRKNGAKYYTSRGQKVLYSPQHIFNSFRLQKEQTVTICEGVYDAIALTILGYPNPIAVLGDQISDRQIYDLRKLLPENAYLALDDWDRSKEIGKTIRSIPSLIDTLILTWKGYKDPEEYLIGEIKKDRDLLNSCVKNTKRWIDG